MRDGPRGQSTAVELTSACDLALAISSMIGAMAIVNASGLGASAFLALWLAISLVLLLIVHAHARDEERPATSVLSSLLIGHPPGASAPAG